MFKRIESLPEHAADLRHRLAAFAEDWGGVKIVGREQPTSSSRKLWRVISTKWPPPAKGFALHPLAAQDITEIGEYIAEDNPRGALILVRECLIA